MADAHPAPTDPSIDPMALLEHLPITAYLLRSVGEDFVLEGVNAVARAKTPALTSMLGRPISLLYADQPEMIEDAKRCQREQVRIERETAVRRHGRVGSVSQDLVFAPVGQQHIVIYGKARHDQQTLSAELSEVEERYRSLLASLPVAMLLRDAEGRVLLCNDLAAKLFGHAAASDLWGRAVLAAPGYRFETPLGQQITPSEWPSEQAVRRGESLRGELCRALTADGSQRWLRISVEPVHKADGSLGGSVTICADETERVIAEQAEREAALQLQLALDAARMGTWSYDPEADRGEWSPMLDQIFQLSEHTNFAGYLNRVPPDDRASTVQAMQQAVSGEHGHAFEHEHRLLGDDGTTRWARVRGRIERSAGRIRLLGTAMDVTERRRLQDELVRASRLESLGRLAGGLAHDFNNLLAAMLGSIELLGDVCPADGQEDLTTMRHITLRARDLTAQLLAFARQQRTELETVDLAALVRKVERLLQRLVGPTVMLSIELDPADALELHVHADAAQLEQVLVNLVVNARDAMPNGGRVTVWLGTKLESAERTWVVLRVTDEGGGIQSQHLAHVFDPFFTTKSTGTGLGLASSYGVVQAHGGTIGVESEPGRGATFEVRLPQVKREHAAPTSLRAAPVSCGRVLVVDDDESVRSSTARMLKTLGYEVLTAASGAEAEALSATPGTAIDILVCDLAMPNRSGHDVARMLSRSYPDLKVLFVSGYPRGAERELPAESFLQKPYDRDTLARKLLALRADRATS
jgi:two-component system cell cycle sensor histidine kinase/response regulator CckA